MRSSMLERMPLGQASDADRRLLLRWLTPYQERSGGWPVVNRSAVEPITCTDPFYPGVHLPLQFGQGVEGDTPRLVEPITELRGAGSCPG
jgi:hypothetical protein